MPKRSTEEIERLKQQAQKLYRQVSDNALICRFNKLMSLGEALTLLKSWRY